MNEALGRLDLQFCLLREGRGAGAAAGSQPLVGGGNAGKANPTWPEDSLHFPRQTEPAEMPTRAAGDSGEPRKGPGDPMNTEVLS